MQKTIKTILSRYSSDNPGTRANLVRILLSGKLSGTGKLVILPVDQGFEHGPVASFAANIQAYNPRYHVELAIEAGLSAFAAPLGMLEIIAAEYAGFIPLILKLNSSNSMNPKNMAPDQAFTGSVSDALRLGCAAVGLTIYPGSLNFHIMLEKAKVIVEEAKKYGLAVVVWSYPRGEDITKTQETTIDVIAYAAHMAALIGAHIIKVKLPTDAFSSPTVESLYKNNNINVKTLEDRVMHIMKCAFDGQRLVVFSGGAQKNLEDLYTDIIAIRDGGGNGSIMGRNTFQRPRDDALRMLECIVKLYGYHE